LQVEATARGLPLAVLELDFPVNPVVAVRVSPIDLTRLSWNRECLADQEISIGDYVLSGGELGAAVMIDTITRLVPGALGNAASARQESFSANEKAGVDGPDSTCGSGGLLDYPHYTRPAEFRGMAVPEVLMGGNHEQIRKWRRSKALEKTLRNRPDLLERQPSQLVPLSGSFLK